MVTTKRYCLFAHSLLIDTRDGEEEVEYGLGRKGNGNLEKMERVARVAGADLKSRNFYDGLLALFKSCIVKQLLVFLFLDSVYDSGAISVISQATFATATT